MMMDADPDREPWILPFLSREARSRFPVVGRNAKQRTKLLNRLCHNYETTLDWRIAQPIPPAEHTAALIESKLRKLGAEKTCYVFCHPADWDGFQVPLAEALGKLLGNGLPVLLVCVPGSLAYFEPEYSAGTGQRFILYRPVTTP